MWRHYWLCLSFANLVYLRAWSDLLPVSSADVFFRKRLPGINLYFAIAGDVLALSLLTLLLVNLAPKMPRWLQHALPVAAIAMVALALRSIGAEGTGLLRAGLFAFAPPRVLFPLVALFAVVLAILAFRYFSLILRLSRVIARAAIPCLAVTFVGTLFSLSARRPLPPNPPLAARLAGSPPVRIFWIIFDEWDQRISFSHRAPGTLLPTLDSLASRSFTATKALAVQAGIPVPQMSTKAAVPSLLYGKLSTRIAVTGANTMHLDFAGGDSTLFGQGNSIFARIRSNGWNSAVAGWYLPYCRIFASQTMDCYWDEKYQQRSSSSHGVVAAALDETRMLFETSLFSVFGVSLVAERHAAEYEALMATARRYAADPSIGFAFIHFNIPHTPYFYSEHSRRFGFSAALYRDALELVDRSVRDLLTSLNRAGLDSKTVVILSSDHPARFSAPIKDPHDPYFGRQDPHVPFIVHFPGQSNGVVATEEFSTMKTADLVLAIARGEVKSPAEVMSALGIANP